MAKPIISSAIVESERRGRVAILRLNRPDKRNAVNDALMGDIERVFDALTERDRAVVICGNGEHFCAGLDLAEHKDRAPFDVVRHSRYWHQVTDKIQFGGRPVLAAMQGAVVGGGLEIAAAAHVRVADETAFYQLPEGRRGIFVGGGASVRVAGIVGVSRVVEMMLTGRRYDAAEGERLGLSHYLVPPGQAFARAMELAEQIAGNAAMSNYMILNALAHIGEAPGQSGLFAESLAAALTQTTEDARKGIEAFLEKRGAEFEE